MFRTIKDNYVNCTDWNSFEDLKDLNEQFSIYLNKEYQNKIHSVIKTTPRQRYKEEINLIKYKLPEEIEKSFLHRVTRKVRKDATISINSIYFEVPQEYISQRIKLRYMPDDLSEIYILNEDNEIINTAYQLKKVDNSKIKRKRNRLDYTQIGGKTNV